ncbi:DsbA family protein [Lelliottia amnigena]|uniref:DsbA family protein n=1 Tax=Lelliottia amnigena TaxID=61646 RepID=UPI0021DB2933|nr:DsbA family protein [Lelliottia amnigena]MCU7783591.1 DsbA family protein [Lelliottia amnigena]
MQRYRRQDWFCHFCLRFSPLPYRLVRRLLPSRLPSPNCGTQHHLTVAIMDAYFLTARNIADAGVLADVAAAYGFSKDETRAIARNPTRHKRIEQEAANFTAAGVRSVPHFVFQNRFAIN